MPPERISVNEEGRNRPEAPIANIADLVGNSLLAGDVDMYLL